jgi:transitional endoplasmic reticulum ATPase
MDGIEEMQGVIVLAATNRPDILDPALLRTGRFDRLVFIGPPSREERLAILTIHTRGMPLKKDVDLSSLAETTDGYTGADLEGLCREAAFISLREDIGSKHVGLAHFEKALSGMRPSVDQATVAAYKALTEEWKGGINKKEKEDKGLAYYG